MTELDVLDTGLFLGQSTKRGRERWGGGGRRNSKGNAEGLGFDTKLRVKDYLQ